MGAEEDVYLPAVGEVLGVGDLLSIGAVSYSWPIWEWTTTRSALLPEPISLPS